MTSARFYFEGPAPGCNYVIDDAVVREGENQNTDHGFGSSLESIDNLRKNDIHVKSV